jgi:hypothetical protein
LLSEDVISGINERNKNGIRDNTPYKWYTMADLIGLVQRKNAQINTLKLAGLNMAHSLLSRSRHLEAHKRFLLAVSEGNVPRMHTLVSVSRKAGDSIYAILDKYNRAARDVFRPLSYEERDYQQVFLFHKLGGVAVAELAHRAFGLPSIETTRRHIVTKPLIASPKMPTVREMAQNLNQAFPPCTGAVVVHRKCGFQLMVDELKLECRMRWDARTNQILGVCREHSTPYSLEFRSMAQAVALRDGIQAEKVHLASEVCT